MLSGMVQELSFLGPNGEFDKVILVIAVFK
jgi:hypothetical protein